MAESTITRKAALEFAIANLDNKEVTEVLSKMLASISKPRKATVSKARVLNEGLARKVVAAMPKEGMTTKEVVALGFPEILTTQKASAVLRVACDLGIATKVTEGKVVTYKPTEGEGEDTPED